MRRLALTMIATFASGICAAAASDVTGALPLERLVQSNARLAPNFQPAPGEHLVMASLPSQQVRGVKSTTDNGGFHQIVELERGAAGLPSNMIDIRYRRTMTDSDIVTMQKPTEAGIHDELAARFPTMEMVVVAQPRKNAYGVYGLAVGKWANGASCIYAWQWADTADTQKTSDSVDALSLRVSVCRSGMTLDALATELDHLRVGPSRMRLVSSVKRPAKIASVRRAPSQPQAPQRAVATVARPAQPASALIQNSPPPAMMPVESKLAAIDPTLDQSLPAAAYQGPTRQSPIQRVAQ